jgi:hypothetical protein
MTSSPLSHTLLVVSIVISLTGCFPMHFVTRPGISGTVVDDATSRPVIDTTVTLRMQPVHGGIATSTSANTDAKGTFSIAPERHWGIYIVPMDFMGLFGTAEFRAPGYAETSREVRTNPAGLAVVPLGEVRLRTTP